MKHTESSSLPENITIEHAKSVISDIFQEMYPKFSGHRNFPWVSDKAKKDLIERLSIIADETKSNGIWMHKASSDYNTLEKACHLDNMERVTWLDFWSDLKTKLLAQRWLLNDELWISPQTSWERIAQHILKELWENEVEFHFDEDQWKVVKILKKAA